MIYAVDFDGTLCDNKWPEIGEPHRKIIDFLKSQKEHNSAQIILWTMREGEMLNQAVEWCRQCGIEFDAVNDNLEQLKAAYGNNPRKVYADYYIDDHNLILIPELFPLKQAKLN